MDLSNYALVQVTECRPNNPKGYPNKDSEGTYLVLSANPNPEIVAGIVSHPKYELPASIGKIVNWQLSVRTKMKTYIPIRLDRLKEPDLEAWNKWEKKDREQTFSDILAYLSDVLEQKKRN